MLSFVANARAHLVARSLRPSRLNASLNRQRKSASNALHKTASFRPSNGLVSRFGCRNYATPEPSDEMLNMPHMSHDGEHIEPELEAEHSLPPTAPTPVIPPTTPAFTGSTPYAASKPQYKNSYTAQRTRQDAESQNGGHTFVSSYYRIDESVFAPYLTRKNLAFKQTGNKQLVIRECPFCHDTKAHPTNLWKLYIYMENGHYFCFRCNAQGSWCVATCASNFVSRFSVLYRLLTVNICECVVVYLGSTFRNAWVILM